MRTLIVGGTLLTPQDSLPDHALLIERGRILGIEPGRPKAGAQDQAIEADGRGGAPGLIDTPVHGALGHDPMQASVAAIHGMARFFAQHGVTSYLPTTLAADPAQTLAAVQCVAECPQPAGAVRLVTIAPECPGALEFIDLAVAQGVEFAIGHSGASYEQVVLAAEHGLRQATHTFNGMVGLNPRTPGTVGGVLTDDRIYAQVIADGVHLHPAVVKLIIRAKGVARTILITDAISPTGLPDGEYQLTGLKITLKDGVSRTSAGGFAGVSLNEALTMATWAPAEAMGWSGKKGSLAPGADADIILLDEALNVQWTMVAGRGVYPRPTP